jgi:hypothetical protein
MQHLLACIRVSNMSSYHCKTVACIEDYILFPALWVGIHKDYTNKIEKKDALSALVANYEMSVKEVKNKIRSIRSYFANITKK